MPGQAVQKTVRIAKIKVGNRKEIRPVTQVKLKFKTDEPTITQITNERGWSDQ